MASATDRLPPPQPSWRINPGRALAVAGLCWLGFAGLVWLVQTGRSGPIDELGLLFWRDATLKPIGPPRLLEGVRDLTALGGVLLRNLFALGAVVALLLLRLRREAALLLLTVAGGWLVNSAAKHVVGRPRPDIVPHLMEAGGASFPSGHSFNAAVVYLAVALAFATLSSRQSVRVTIIATALAVSLTVAWTRVWLGVHFPSDVIAGWLGGTGWAFLAVTLLHRPAEATARASEQAIVATKAP